MKHLSLIALSCCLGGLAGAAPPAPEQGPIPAAKRLVLPGFRTEEAARQLAREAIEKRGIPGAVVVVIAVDERRLGVEIGTAVSRQFELRAYHLQHRIGNLRLYALMRKPGAFDETGLGLHNYGCFFPSSAATP